MADQTSIEWTDHTFNPWWGCARVSPACRFCYADGTATRWGHELWRRKGPRRMLSEANWRNPLKWNRAAKDAGLPAKVFCASMADVFEVHPVAEVNAQLDGARLRLWSLIEQTPWLIWQLLTTRPENVAALTPWPDEWPANVWLGTSVEDNRRAAERIPVLLQTNARTLFLSCEPLLAPVDLSGWLPRPLCSACSADMESPMCDACYTNFEATHIVEGDFVRRRCVDWVIAGGESGPNARPMHPGWARSLRDQCEAADVAFFFKQWGEWAPAGRGIGVAQHNLGREVLVGQPLDDVGYRQVMRRVGKSTAGRELDGRTWDDFPPVVTPMTSINADKIPTD